MIRFLSFYIALFFSMIPSLHAEIKTQVETQYFQFNANGISQLVNTIRKKGPKVSKKSVWALIKWDLYTEYRFKTVKNGCVISAYDLEIVANITLPKWQNINNQEMWIQKWWQAYIKFVSDHEHNHFQNVYQSAVQFEQNIKAMTPQPSCTAAKHKFLELKHQYLDMVNRQDRQIDREAKRRFYAKEKLFVPLNKDATVKFESGLMNSYIGL